MDDVQETILYQRQDEAETESADLEEEGYSDDIEPHSLEAETQEVLKRIQKQTAESQARGKRRHKRQYGIKQKKQRTHIFTSEKSRLTPNMEILLRRENFVRTNDAVYELFADILRDELSDQIPPLQFRQKINKTSSTKLKKMHLSGDVIQNVENMASYQGMDVTTLNSILRNICCLSGQLAEDIEKIKNLRNKWCAHSPVNEMNSDEFEKIWTEFEGICRRMDNRTPNKGYLKRLHQLKDREVLITVKHDTTQRCSQVLRVHQFILDNWKKQNTNFFITRACQVVEKRLADEPIITITGNIGAGKSAIAGHISLQYLDAGWKVFPVRNTREIERLLDFEFSSKQLFVLENPIGKDAIDDNLIREWKLFENFIAMLEKKDNLKVLTTCREQILRELSSGIILPKKVVSLEDKLQLNSEEKLGVLKCHVNIQTFTEKERTEIITKASKYFPLLCSLFGEKTEYQKEGIKFFLEPGKFVAEEVMFYKNNDKKKFCALILLIKNKGSIIEGTKWNEDIFSYFRSLAGLPNTVCQSEISEQYDILSGHLLKREGKVVMFSSDFIMNIASYVFGKEYPGELVLICSIQFLRTRIFFEDSEPASQRPDFTIFLSKAHVPMFINRILSSLKDNCLDICFCPALNSPMVKSALVETITLLEDKEFDIFLAPMQHKQPIPWPFSQKERFIAYIQNVLRYFRASQKNIESFKEQSRSVNFSNIETASTSVVYNHDQSPVCFSRWQYEVKSGDLGEIKKITKKGITEDEELIKLFEHGMINFFHFVLPSDILKDILIAFVKLSILTSSKNFCEFERQLPSSESFESFLGKMFQIAMNDESLYDILRANGISELNLDNLMTILTEFSEKDCGKFIYQFLFCLFVTNFSDVKTEFSAYVLDTLSAIPLSSRPAFKEIIVDFTMILRRIFLNVIKMYVVRPPFLDIYSRIPTREYLVSHLEILLRDGLKALPSVIPVGKFFHYAFQDIMQDENAKSLKEDMVIFSLETSPFKCFTLFGYTEIFQTIFSRVKNMEHERVIKACDHIFLAACAMGKIDIVKNIYTYIQETAKFKRWFFIHNSYDALQISSAMHHHEILSFLLLKDFDVNVVDAFGNTPLLLCLQYMKKEMDFIEKQTAVKVLKCLLKNGADVMHSNLNGFCALHLACKLNYPDIVSLVLMVNNINKTTKSGDSPIYIASSNGNADVVRLLHKRGAKVNIQNMMGCSPLFVAAANGHVEVIRILLKFGAILNLPNFQKISPLSIASKQGHLEAVQLLLEKKAYVHQRDILFYTPALLAAQFGHIDCLSLLLQNGSCLHEWNENGENMLFLACKEGNFDIAKMLIEQGADIEKSTIDGKRPLLAAIISNNIKETRLLLENGAKISSYQQETISALHYSSSKGQEEMVELLLQYGADVNETDINGMTAIHAGVISDNKNIVSKLLDYNCSVNIRGSNLETALHIASRNGCLSLVEFLINKGAIVNHKDVFGETPLHLAAVNSCPKIAQILLEKGSNINECDNQHISPLFMASRKGFVDIVLKFLDAGANTELCDVNGISPLMTASANGHADVVKRLIELEANVNRRDLKGRTALWYAAANGKYIIAEKLLLESTSIVNIPDHELVTPVMIAANAKHTKTVLILLEYGSRVSSVRIIYEMTEEYTIFVVSDKQLYRYFWFEQEPKDYCVTRLFKPGTIYLKRLRI